MSSEEVEDCTWGEGEGITHLSLLEILEASPVKEERLYGLHDYASQDTILTKCWT